MFSVLIHDSKSLFKHFRINKIFANSYAFPIKIAKIAFFYLKAVSSDRKIVSLHPNSININIGKKE